MSLAMVHCLNTKTLLLAASLFSGLFFFLYRLGFLSFFRTLGQKSSNIAITPPYLVSVLVPARNEAENLPALLLSLNQQVGVNTEIIVIDDNSSDNTALLARQYGAHVVHAGEKPAGWSGKNWACHRGSLVAKGDFLLFTDADTVHHPQGLRQSLEFLQATGNEMCSALPFHRCPTFWEKANACFFLFVLLAAAPYQAHRRKTPYCIGQYLLFKKEAYARLGGHRAISRFLAEDLQFAKQARLHGTPYGVITHVFPYQVRMYKTFREFIRGWRRNIRLGLRAGSFWAPCEIALIFSALMPFQGHLACVWPLKLVTFLFLFYRIKTYGEFSFFSVVFLPLSMLLFSFMTVLAVFDSVFGKTYQWKSRTY